MRGVDAIRIVHVRSMTRLLELLADLKVRGHG